MSLDKYFINLMEKVENSDEITNAGKDDNGFYKPRKTILLRNLKLLLDLHKKPLARDMVKGAWQAVARELPEEWLVLNDQDKAELKKILN